MKLPFELKDDFSEKVHYNSPGFPIYIRENSLSQYPNYSAVSHWHNDVEFIAILSGQMQYNVNGNIISLDKGNGIFVNSRQLHYGFSQNYSDCKFICILLHPILLCVSRYIEEKYILPIISNKNIPFCLLEKNVGWQYSLLKLILQMSPSSKKPISELQIQSIIFSIWDLLNKHVPSFKNTIHIKQNNNLVILKYMIGYIQKNHYKKLTLSDIAASGMTCVSKCCFIFQKYINLTPIAYLTDYRLKKSINLLCLTDMTITQISYKVGFSGASYYSEIFRKNFNCTPTQYRKLHKATIYIPNF